MLRASTFRPMVEQSTAAARIWSRRRARRSYRKEGAASGVTGKRVPIQPLVFFVLQRKLERSAKT